MKDELGHPYDKHEKIETISFTMIKSIIYAHKNSIYNEFYDLLNFIEFWDIASSLDRKCKFCTPSINIDGYYGTNHKFI